MYKIRRNMTLHHEKYKYWSEIVQRYLVPVETNNHNSGYKEKTGNYMVASSYYNGPRVPNFPSRT